MYILYIIYYICPELAFVDSVFDGEREYGRFEGSSVGATREQHGIKREHVGIGQSWCSL